MSSAARRRDGVEGQLRVRARAKGGGSERQRWGQPHSWNGMSMRGKEIVKDHGWTRDCIGRMVGTRYVGTEPQRHGRQGIDSSGSSTGREMAWRERGLGRGSSGEDGAP